MLPALADSFGGCGRHSSHTDTRQSCTPQDWARIENMRKAAEELAMNQQNVGSKRNASSGTGKIAAKSQEAAEQWKDAVVDQANEVRDKAQSMKDHTSERIRGVATQLQNASETLRDDDPLVADFAERASRGVESIAQYVSSASAQTLVRDSEQLARRQPALFFGGAFLLGLAAGRFLKSSAPGASSPSSSSEGGDNRALVTTRQDRPSGFFPADRDVAGATFARDSARRAEDGIAGVGAAPNQGNRP
jgi:hypothetical protein